MGFRKSIILSLMILPLVTACSFSKAPPSSLAPLNNPLPVDTLWYKHINESTKEGLAKYTPAVDTGVLFTADTKGNIVASQLSTGEVNWRIRLKNPASGGVAVGNQAVYVPTIKGEIYALSQKDGHILWQASLPDQSNTAATYNNGQLFIKTIDDKLVALDANTGKTLWIYDEGATQFQLLGSSSPVVTSTQVIAGFSDGEVDAINRKTGELMWQTLIAIPTGFSDLGRMIGVFANPIIQGNTVYAVSYQGSLSAINLNDGSVRWRIPLSDYAGISLGNNNVITVTTDGDIIAYNQNSGKLSWQQIALHGRSLSGPAMDGNNIVIGDDLGNVHWLNGNNGNFVARSFIGKSPVVITPLVINRKVIVLSENGNVFVMQVGS